MAAPLKFKRTTGDDGLYIHRARAEGWLIGLSAFAKDLPITLSHDTGAMFINIDLTAQHARAMAAELLAMADLAEQAAATTQGA